MRRIFFGAVFFLLTAMSVQFGNMLVLDKMATASLPTAGAVNIGAIAYDTTLNTPTYSDGGSWHPVLVAGVTLGTALVNVGIATGTTYGGAQLPARGFNVIALRMRNSTAATGTGNVTFRVTDATNNCDFVYACSVFSGNVSLRLTPTTGTCAFPASANLNYQVLTSACTGVQPVILNGFDVVGFWE